MNADVTIFHNPACSTSRNTLALLRERGIEPRVVEYLRTPLDREQLTSLLRRLDMKAADLVRWKEALCETLGLRPDQPEAALIDAMAEHPRLMNRPIVVTPRGARLGRPMEKVLEVLED